MTIEITYEDVRTLLVLNSFWVILMVLIYRFLLRRHR